VLVSPRLPLLEDRTRSPTSPGRVLVTPRFPVWKQKIRSPNPTGRVSPSIPVLEKQTYLPIPTGKVSPCIPILEKQILLPVSTPKEIYDNRPLSPLEFDLWNLPSPGISPQVIDEWLGQNSPEPDTPDSDLIILEPYTGPGTSTVPSNPGPFNYNDFGSNYIDLTESETGEEEAKRLEETWWNPPTSAVLEEASKTIHDVTEEDPTNVEEKASSIYEDRSDPFDTSPGAFYTPDLQSLLEIPEQELLPWTGLDPHRILTWDSMDH